MIRIPLAIPALLVLTVSGIAARAGPITGTGELSGRISASAPFTAAKVFAHLKDRNITYVVFTRGGRYEALNLMPGRYEVWVEKPGFASDRTSVDITSGRRAAADFALRVAPAEPSYVGASMVRGKIEPLDMVYPLGHARDVIERTCIVCHGWNFLPAVPQSREGWTAVLDYMTRSPRWGIKGEAPFLSTERLPPADRDQVLDYLVGSFGPDAPKRTVAGDPEPPLDEAVLGKAMFIQYDLPNGPGFPHRVTQEVTFDSGGNVWVTDVRDDGAITRIDPRTGAFRDYPTPGKDWNPHGIAVDADDTIWFAALKAGLGHLDPATGRIDVYGKTGRQSGGLSPFIDSKGNVYWTDIRVNELGRWDRATGTWKRYPSPSPVGSPYGIVIDHDDRVWYAEFHGCAVVRFDPATEQLKAFRSPSAPCTIRRPAVDSKGNVWYGIWNRGRIERLEPATGKVTAFDVPVPFADPYDTWVDSHDIVWSSSDNFLIRLDPRTGRQSYYPTPQRTDEPKVTITRDGAIWFPPRGFSSAGGAPASVDVLYPDKAGMKTFAAYFWDGDPNANSHRYKGPATHVAGNALLEGRTTATDRAAQPELGAAAD